MRRNKGIYNKLGLRKTIKTTIITMMLIIVSFQYINLANSDDASFKLKWTYETGQDVAGGIGPLAVDLNNDGIMEIFVNGDNTASSDKVFCFNGNTGALKWVTTLKYSIVPHCPMEIYDLDNDKTYELIQPGPNGLEVLNAEDGTLYWRNSTIRCSEAHQLVLDTDKNGYPYIYTCWSSSSGYAELCKIDGRTGRTLITKDIWYPCHGGLSAADVDNDGDFEIFMSDRSTGDGKGPQCYDAATLNLIWYKKSIYCASHLPVIVDVNKDGVLDVVVSQQRTSNAGIYCLDGRNGNYITGKYQDSISGLATHESFPIYDIDSDGNLELATCAYSNVKVFDLGKWQIEATLEYDGKPPYYANVMGDASLEIILSEEVSNIKIFNNKYQLIYTIPSFFSYGSTVQDIDGDGLNELIAISGDGTVRAYDTLATAPNPRPRTNTNHYSERNTRTAIYISPPVVSTKLINNPPIISNPNPANGATNIPITTNKLSITIQDKEASLMNYTITTSPNLGTITQYNIKSGTKIFTISGLAYSTTYRWYVRVNDGNSLTTKTYTFTTQSDSDSTPPKISNIVLTISNPMDTQTGFGWENISCTITDNIDVNRVCLIITYPNNIIYNNSMMNQPGTNLYYYNTTHSKIGDYTYFIWAKDTNDNSNSSITHEFTMIPNWDINKDGKCTVIDIVLISSYFGKTGSPGWTRKDVDNNGRIDVFDFTLIAKYYGKSWY